MVISARNRSKSMPGMRFLYADGEDVWETEEDRSVPTISIGERGTVLGASRVESAHACQPAGVWRIWPARSSDSRASPRRWFCTDSVSRSLVRVSPCRRAKQCQDLVLQSDRPIAESVGDDFQVRRLAASWPPVPGSRRAMPERHDARSTAPSDARTRRR